MLVLMLGVVAVGAAALILMNIDSSDGNEIEDNDNDCHLLIEDCCTLLYF